MLRAPALRGPGDRRTGQPSAVLILHLIAAFLDGVKVRRGSCNQRVRENECIGSCTGGSLGNWVGLQCRQMVAQQAPPAHANKMISQQYSESLPCGSGGAGYVSLRVNNRAAAPAVSVHWM
jgi:hypothetical protein